VWFRWVIGVFDEKKDRGKEGQVASVLFFVSPLIFFKWLFDCFKEEWRKQGSSHITGSHFK
jgi:hypothetical protein